MARRIVIDCDACSSLDVDTGEEAGTVGLVLPELGAITLDLCPVHRKEWLEPLTELAREYGVKGGTIGAALTKATPASSSTRKGRPPAHEDRPHACVCCPADYASASGLRLHYANVHGLDEPLSTLYGSTCPLCGEPNMSTHHLKATHGLPLTEGMVKADREGDRYGVVRTLRARAQNVS